MPHDTRTQVFIEAADLAALLASDTPPVLLDVRVPGEEGDGRADYRAGHIAGAVFVDLATELADEPAGPVGRRPLPAAKTLQRDARRWGISKNQPVVVYDDSRGQRAGRAWWVLRWGGVADVRVLSGGLTAWIAAGGATTTAIPLPDPGDVVITPGHLPVVTAEAAQAHARDGTLLDARGAKHYAAGHIPGAISAPTSANLGADGRFADPETLRARFAELGVDGTRSIAVSCGGGVSAAHQIAALASIGITAALFPASWSGWSADPSRPIATGAQRG
ncbi:sulfurtransferase [Humitalea sp. 24SJ18S-53]|uniref:sulfurtransferase n=1 Tax=Humitalea sp. 24SJ18S-53 TaxID=3422307 RepID=UPI003D66D342